MLFENDGQIVRFPQIKPEDQGQYQCFVQTDGYPQRAAGRGQKIIVKGKFSVRINNIQSKHLGRFA